MGRFGDELTSRPGGIQPLRPATTLKTAMNRSNTFTRNLIGVLALALFAAASPVLAKDKTEDELIADLAASGEGKVTEALLKLEKQYPTSTKALPTMKKLLK